MDHDLLVQGALHAFHQNYHRDRSNAHVHTAPVRFSSLTVLLARGLAEKGRTSDEVEAVISWADAQ